MNNKAYSAPKFKTLSIAATPKTTVSKFQSAFPTPTAEKTSLLWARNQAPESPTIKETIPRTRDLNPAPFASRKTAEMPSLQVSAKFRNMKKVARAPMKRTLSGAGLAGAAIGGAIGGCILVCCCVRAITQPSEILGWKKLIHIFVLYEFTRSGECQI